MLAIKLSRARLELQAHRIWLRSFSLTKNATASLTTKTPRPPATSRRPKTTGIGPQFPTRNNASPKDLSPKDARLVALQRQITQASKDFDFDGAMAGYRAIEDKNLVIQPVMDGFTQALLSWTRRDFVLQKDRRDEETSDKVQSIVNELVEDHYKGTLGPCPSASAHLLDCFTVTEAWDTGSKYWKWLEAKDDEYVNTGTYAAAIDLLSAQDTKIEDLEALYQQALGRLPVGFAAYHFSPGAVVPNREQSLVLPALPTSLLRSIMVARLMRGDAQNAYLALDSVLRVSPVTKNHLLFTAYQKERPVAEAYTVFAMACKAGTVLPSAAYRNLLSSLRNNADTWDARRFVLTVRAMLSATYLHIGAGGKLSRNAVTELIIVLTYLLRIKGIIVMAVEEKEELRDIVQDLIRRTMELAARFNAFPTIAACNSIITNIAGLGNAEKTITTAIKDAQALGLVPTLVTRRSIIVAAGAANDGDLVKQGWQWLLDARAKAGQLPDTTDLHVLTKACAQTDQQDFAHDQIVVATHLEPWQQGNLFERVQTTADVVERRSSSKLRPADMKELVAEFAKIKADLEVFDERTSDARGVQDFSVQHLPMMLFSPPREVRLPEAEMRKLYDELTTDPNPPTAVDTREPVVARDTKVPFSRLRYENWKHITYLLAEAERHDQAYINAVDFAMFHGKTPPQRNYGELFEGEDKITGVGLSDSPQEFEASSEEVDVEKARAKICQLRQVSLPQTSSPEA
jgi:hypothetical protein